MSTFVVNVVVDVVATFVVNVVVDVVATFVVNVVVDVVATGTTTVMRCSRIFVSNITVAMVVVVRFLCCFVVTMLNQKKNESLLLPAKSTAPLANKAAPPVVQNTESFTKVRSFLL